MRLKTEKVLNDIETYLEETAELPWGTAHIILMEAKDQIASLQRQLDNKELTDEEIKFIAYPFESVYTTYDKQTDTDTVHTRFDQLGFARAILRKAQEK